MSRFKTLGPGWAALLDDSELEDSMGVDLLVALGHEARLRDAARALALEEHQLGVHVDESEPMGEVLRLAADDGAGEGRAVVFALGRLRISAQVDADGLVLSQLDGGAGVTVVLGDTWVPLQLGVAARAAGVTQVPDRLTVLDRKGRRRTLAPEDPTSR